MRKKYQKHVACNNYAYKLACVNDNLFYLLSHTWVKMLFTILLTL